MQKTSLTEIKTASWTVTEADSGKTYVIDGTSGSVVATLPATVSGLNYRFVIAVVAGSGAGFAVSPVAADSINGGVDNKDLINSAATDAKGDAIEIWGDGSVGYYTTSKVGTWAAEA